MPPRALLAGPVRGASREGGSALGCGGSCLGLARSCPLKDEEEEAHPEERRSDGCILARRPPEVALITGPEHVETKAHRPVEREEKANEKACGTGAAVEQEKERRDRDRVQELEQAEVEARAVREAHGKPARGR